MTSGRPRGPEAITWSRALATGSRSLHSDHPTPRFRQREPGHAAIEYTNPADGGDVLLTIWCEFHRPRPETTTATRRDVGSSIFQVFEGSGEVTLGTQRHSLVTGDLFVVLSWIRTSPTARRATSDPFTHNSSYVAAQRHILPMLDGAPRCPTVGAEAANTAQGGHTPFG